MNINKTVLAGVVALQAPILITAVAAGAAPRLLSESKKKIAIMKSDREHFGPKLFGII